jgi:hypothetical protein
VLLEVSSHNSHASDLMCCSIWPNSIVVEAHRCEHIKSHPPCPSLCWQTAV